MFTLIETYAHGNHLHKIKWEVNTFHLFHIFMIRDAIVSLHCVIWLARLSIASLDDFKFLQFRNFSKVEFPCESKLFEN